MSFIWGKCQAIPVSCKVSEFVIVSLRRNLRSQEWSSLSADRETANMNTGQHLAELMIGSKKSPEYD